MPVCPHCEGGVYAPNLSEPRKIKETDDMSEEIRLDGRVAIITGAGGGLGRSYALLLAERGAKIVVNDLGGGVDGSGASQNMADQVVDEIRRSGGEAVANYDSVATPEAGEAIVRTAIDAFGKVDILINNAGILRDRSLAKMSSDEFDAVLDVHLRGAFHVTRPAFANMKQNGYGRILFTSSAAGLFGNFGQANYAAAKMGLVGLSSVVAIEGEKYDIRSNVIAPIAKTRLSEHVLGPFGDVLDIDYVKPLVAYLVSEQCTATHEIFSVGGGKYARVFVGLGAGWHAERPEKPTPEMIRDHWQQIMSIDDFTVPRSATEEIMTLGAQLQQ